MIIAVDILSGEKPADVLIRGAIDATKEKDISVILIGNSAIIEEKLKKFVYNKKKVEVVHTDEFIGMDEIPTKAIKEKPRSSVIIAAELVKSGKADAFVSPGNTGASLTAAYIKFGRLKGVSRPAILAHIPKGKDSFTALLDVGANIESKPINLVQFAVMGEVYAETVWGIKKPKIGLLSNGSEESKGTEITRKSYKILKRLPLNFVGYIEGRDIFTENVDVAVCDGFVGNILLKGIEGIGKLIFSFFKEEIRKYPFSQLGALLMSGTFKTIRKKVDYAEYGGAPLIGLNKPCIISHGSASSKEIYNAIKVAARIVNYKLNKNIVARLREYDVTKFNWFNWERFF